MIGQTCDSVHQLRAVPCKFVHVLIVHMQCCVFAIASTGVWHVHVREQVRVCMCI